MRSEKGSITVLSFVTVMFILIILATLFYSIVEKSKSQVIEMEKLSNTYDGDMGEIYKERKGKQGVFATYYSNGSLVFTNTRKTLEGRGTATEYGDVTTLTTVPWDAKKASIVKVEFLDKIAPNTTANWFSNCSNLTTITNIENLDTSNVNNMNNMFYMCSKLANLDVSSFNTSKVTNMSGMFSGCGNLKTLDINGIDTSNVINMEEMFNGCTGLTNLDLSSFSTIKVTNITRFLGACTNLTNLDISDFDISAVTTYNDFIPNLSTSAVIKTNETMATWLRTNFSGVSGNIQVI